MKHGSRPDPLRKRFLGWLKRYLPVDGMGILFSYLTYYLLDNILPTPLMLAYAAAWGENLGFYGAMIVREFRIDQATARRRLHDYGWKERFRTIKNVFAEFGFSEAVDSLLIRPFCLNYAVGHLGSGLGIFLGARAADVIFYALTIFSYELRKHRERRNLHAHGAFHICGDEKDWSQRLQAVEDCSLFAFVEPDDRKFITGLFERKEFRDGEWICRRGDGADEFFIILRGAVEIRRSGSGRPITMDQRGSIVGYYAFFANNRRTTDLKACGKTSLLAMKYEKFRRFLLAFPDATLALLKEHIEQKITPAHQIS